jgi:hypothetical protein
MHIAPVRADTVWAQNSPAPRSPPMFVVAPPRLHPRSLRAGEPDALAPRPT